MARNPAEIAHGPMLIGTMLNVMLYGITITQTYLYSTSAKRDRWQIRLFVYVLFVADTVQTLFMVMYMYISVIKHFGDTNYLTTADWIFASEPAFTGIFGGVVQAFFAWRVKVLTGNLLLFIVILLCAAASFFMGIATAIGVGIVLKFVEFQKFQVVVIIWLVSAAFADILITGTLVLYLRRHRTGFSSTDGHIDRIIRLTVQTGLFTAVWALIDLMVYLLDATGTHLIFNTPLSKLYVNSLMSSLNARRGWKYGSDEPLHNSYPETRRTDPVVQLNSCPEVFVHVESHEMVDGNSANKEQRPTLTDEPHEWSQEKQNHSNGITV